MKRKGSLSVAMDAAIKAWCLRQPSEESNGAQIARFAVAHGVSASGLRRALLLGDYIKPSKLEQVAV